MPSETPTACWKTTYEGECTCALDQKTGKMVWILRDQTGGSHGEYCTTSGPHNDLNSDVFNLEQEPIPGSQRVVEYVQQGVQGAIETHGPDVALGVLGAVGIGYTIKFAWDNVFRNPHEKKAK